MKTNKERFTYVTYVGTTKVAFLKARAKSPDRAEVVALSARLADGFERGIVKDLGRASQTLTQVVSDVIPPKEKSVIASRLVVSNVYLKNYIYQSSVYFPNNPHPITLRDIRAAIAQTRSVATIPLQEVIVQTVPQEFLVNDLAGVQNPIGLEASRLGVTLRLLTLDFLVYNNLQRAFERCDLEITDIIPSVLSAANSVLTFQEKQAGVILVVIGGEATHFACYKNSVLVETRSLPVGGDLITEEIARNLNIELLDAQRLKESFGSAVPKVEFQEELIPIPDSEGHKKHPIKRSEFERYLSSGLSRLIEEISRTVKSLQEQYAPLTQVVVSGGGARLEGFVELMQDLISPTTRLGISQGIAGPSPLVSDASFVGILGGIHFTSKVSDPNSEHSSRQNWVAKTVETAKNWIFEYL